MLPSRDKIKKFSCLFSIKEKMFRIMSLIYRAVTYQVKSHSSSIASAQKYKTQQYYQSSKVLNVKSLNGKYRQARTFSPLQPNKMFCFLLSVFYLRMPLTVIVKEHVLFSQTTLSLTELDLLAHFFKSSSVKKQFLHRSD